MSVQDRIAAVLCYSLLPAIAAGLYLRDVTPLIAWLIPVGILLILPDARQPLGKPEAGENG